MVELEKTQSLKLCPRRNSGDVERPGLGGLASNYIWLIQTTFVFVVEMPITYALARPGGLLSRDTGTFF